MWMVQSLKHIDFGYDIFIKEAFRIGTYSPTFSYRDLKEMAFDQYSTVIEETLRMQKHNKDMEDAS